ncbi:NAD(P)/FAD-dependent oxidoreductase [Lederbergia sp. NSJ-179]|uniref:NAD(P)/FAD-dependent oxidoreductase n=1 Tax=Lederbergia sp. NSJ-179 TaxID=2931402 RepID=UPI001FD07809|nr:NAD(P)/FAD-dependent oxidoreductase [Lederbergia sp. NSJ-179]MCJ7842386.1 NAD(P)/FAD-dependent oxidoreductase [Lederbergia sp. NSJ-179]
MNDVIIIGAGPAGLSAGIACAKYGLKVLILDEFMFAGGRLLGQLYQEPNGIWWNGIEESRKLTEEAVRLGVDIRLNTSIHNIEKNGIQWDVYTEQNIFQTPSLLLATGAAEAPIPIPGWTLPGVMSIGAAQVMTNLHRVKPGKKGIIIGMNILSAAIATELKLAGVELYALTLPKRTKLTEKFANPISTLDSLASLAHLAPNKFIQLSGNFLRKDFFSKMILALYPKKGIKVSGIPFQLKKAVIDIYGENSVEGVTIASIDRKGTVIPNSEKQIEVDFVCIAGGLYPLAELAALAGCPFYYIEELGGYVPLHNEKMETTVEGLFVAGNITGIEGAKVAIAQGTTAGLTIVHKSGVNVEKELQNSILKINETRENALIQFHPKIAQGRQKIFQEWEKYYSDSQVALTYN